VNLKDLIIGGAPQLADLSPLGTLQQLRSLTLANCPEVADLSPLNELASLKQLTLDPCSPDLDTSVVSPSIEIIVRDAPKTIY
jgi:hypothetical protein